MQQTPSYPLSDTFGLLISAYKLFTFLNNIHTALLIDFNGSLKYFFSNVKL